jgi:hypothetical protein
MQKTSTWLVAPKYKAMIFGFDAVEICARKAHLLINGKRVKSAFYKQSDNPSSKTYWDWITFINGANA